MPEDAAPTPPAADASVIHIKGARQHNLKNLELRLPRGKLIALTGVSGSGKSSLAFDTLYAEGYRKYMDSLSVQARQLLDQVPRPEVDFIHGLSPVIAIEQRPGPPNPRATVATASEVAAYARLLWAIGGEAFCPLDGGRIERRSLDDCVARVLQEPAGCRIQILAPWMEAKPAALREEWAHLRQRGYQRVRLGGRIVELGDEEALRAAGSGPVRLEIVVDRLVLNAEIRGRLADSLETAFREGGDRAVILAQDGAEAPVREFPLSQQRSCSVCGTVYAPLSPKSFSHDHGEGACPDCGGLGRSLRFAPELVVPDPEKSVRGGAIKPWRLGSKRMIIQRNAILKQLAEQAPFDPELPWKDLPEAARALILHGAAERQFAFKLTGGNRKPEVRPFAGVLADLENTRRETSSDGLRARLLTYQTSAECPGCAGSRLKAESRAVRLDSLGYADFLRLDLEAAHGFISRLRLPPAYADAWTGLEQRLRFLNEVGLGYLTLERGYDTLSGGEAQRVRLATQLGMGLVGVTYVLDEPTVGLHTTDTRRLLHLLEGLRDRGNTVIVVEHDAEILRAADHLVEIGPAAGRRGGECIFEGPVAAAEAHPRSLSGAYLAGRRRIEKGGAPRRPDDRWIIVRGATANNLRGIDARFPVGLLTCVTGPSGSGKSTLVNDILGAAAAFRLNGAKAIPLPHRKIEGLSHFERLVRVDQDPIGRSPRSNPATFTKLFDELRALYALCPLAKVRGYGPSRFSFNVRGGRCERCQGDGATRLDMQFLADAYAVCPSCGGRRYNRETLEVRYKGLNIAEALDLTVDEAVGLLGRHPKIGPKLETLQAVGLGYLQLGQAANTLSGGEAQRLKLSLELGKRAAGPTLYLLDEPTTGLHWADIQLLLDLLFKLRDQGHTVVVIEHHPDIARLADWVLELGPGGGRHGGQVVREGAP